MKIGTKKRFNHELESAATPSTVEEEVENVEYLDECVTDDPEGIHGELALQQLPGSVEAVVEDTFYPNAVQCLISLYSDKYGHQMNDPHKKQTIYKSIWNDISKDMRESYFEFDADQVRLKFTQLRRQYFSVSSRTEADNFEYFNYFHEMYNDKVISNFLNGDSIPAYTTSKNQSFRTYRDDDLFAVRYQPESHEINKKEHTVEIAHKKNEFMDIVGREPRALGDKASHKRESQDLKDVEILSPKSKRSRIDNIKSLFSTKPNPESTELLETKPEPEDSTNKKVDMSLAAYNEAQQRRHEEKMNLLRQALLLQGRTIDVQSKLLDEIIKKV